MGDRSGTKRENVWWKKVSKNLPGRGSMRGFSCYFLVGGSPLLEFRFCAFDQVCVTSAFFFLTRLWFPRPGSYPSHVNDRVRRILNDRRPLVIRSGKCQHFDVLA